MFENVRIVLSHTSHPGNIGAAARAMMNMGLSRLYLGNPQRYPHAEATARASGAIGILKNAQVCSSVEEAVADCQLIFAASARSRTLPWPVCPPRQCAHDVVSASKDQEVALLFGNERAGLSNDELVLANAHVCIPTVEQFSSLNLAQAVQVLVYELFIAKAGEGDSELKADRELITSNQMQGLMGHLQDVLYKVDFLDPKHPKMLMKRLLRLFHRAELDVTELNILRGILSSVERTI